MCRNCRVVNADRDKIHTMLAMPIRGMPARPFYHIFPLEALCLRTHSRAIAKTSHAEVTKSRGDEQESAHTAQPRHLSKHNPGGNRRIERLDSP